MFGIKKKEVVPVVENNETMSSKLAIGVLKRDGFCGGFIGINKSDKEFVNFRSEILNRGHMSLDTEETLKWVPKVEIKDGKKKPITEADVLNSVIMFDSVMVLESNINVDIFKAWSDYAFTLNDYPCFLFATELPKTEFNTKKSATKKIEDDFPPMMTVILSTCMVDIWFFNKWLKDTSILFQDTEKTFCALSLPEVPELKKMLRTYSQFRNGKLQKSKVIVSSKQYALLRIDDYYEFISMKLPNRGGDTISVVRDIQKSGFSYNQNKKSWMASATKETVNLNIVKNLIQEDAAISMKPDGVLPYWYTELLMSAGGGIAKDINILSIAMRKDTSIVWEQVIEMYNHTIKEANESKENRSMEDSEVNFT